jgi:hypothetical protein
VGDRNGKKKGAGVDRTEKREERRKIGKRNGEKVIK